MPEARKRRKFRWVRRVAIALVVGFVVLFVVVAVGGPSIASAMAPAIASRLGLPGRVEVESVSLSWRGDLSVGRAAIYDPQDKHVASVSVHTAGGLLGLLDGRLDNDVVLDGWATVEIHEDGTTNIERALGLERGAEADAVIEAEQKGEAGALPFARVVFDGLDLSLTMVGSPTLAIAGLSGEAEAEGQRIKAVAAGTLTMPPQHPEARREIEEAPKHGTFDLNAEIGLQDFSGLAKARVKNLTPEVAAALGALSGDETLARAATVAARGGLGLELDAKLTAAMPTEALVKLSSETVNANLALETRDGAVRLESPGTVEIDTAAFLADDVIRQRVMPGEGVRVTQAGRLTLNLERLSVPMEANKPKLEQAEATVRVQAGRTLLRVPGPDGTPVVVRVSTLEASAIVDVGTPLTLTALAKAGVRGQPDGEVQIDATLDLGAIPDTTAGDHALDVNTLTRLAPMMRVSIDSIPTLAAKPWLASLDALGLDVPRIVGPNVNAVLAWTRGVDGAADVTLDVDTQHVQAKAGAQWTGEAITLTVPATLNIARPNAIAAAWLPEGWLMENGQGVQANVPELRLPMAGFKPDLAATTARATLRAAGAKVHQPTAPTLGIETLELRLATSGSQTTIELSSKPTVNGKVATLDASLKTAGLGALLDRPAERPPAILGTVDLSAPAQLAGAFGIDFAGRPLQQWVTEAVGPSVTARLNLTEPTEDGLLAGTLNVDAQHTKLTANGIDLTRAGLSMSGATLRATPSKPLWDGLAPVLKLEGSTLASTAPIVVEVGPVSLLMGEGTDLATGLVQTSAKLTSQGPITINGVPTSQPDEAGERPRTDVSLAKLEGGLNSIGRAMRGGSDVQGSLNTVLESPGQGRIAVVNAEVQSGERGTLNAHLVIDELNTQLSTALAGLGEGAASAIQGSLGADGRVELRASARATQQGPTPWALQTASVDVQTPRVTTAEPIEAEFSRDSITLVKPATLTWTPDAMWLDSTIGAQVASVKPFEITLDRVAVGNPLAGEFALLDPTLVFIDAAVNGHGATIAIKDRPNIELDTVTGRIRRVGLSTYSVTSKATTAGGGTLELNGLIDKPTDVQGRLSLETAEVRGTLKGDDVPVALADAMSNTNGLLADSLGEVVDLDAEIQHGKLIPGQPPEADLRFSVRGPRAVASGYGRLADHVISMPESQTLLTVYEVKPEIAQRFSQIIPELLRVEKRPEDGPAVVRTEGLSIPTNGDWARGQGKMVVALGTARFKASSVLSGVLKATGQREQGSLGRRVDPIHISMVDGVVTYDPFDLPIGDLTLHSEGSVDLPANSMDVLVWIPMAALSDEAAGSFNTGLGSAIGRTIPGFGSATTVPWRVSGQLNKPSIRPAPRVLIERRGSQLLGPLLRPGESLQDLLSIPRKREQPSGGG